MRTPTPRSAVDILRSLRAQAYRVGARRYAAPRAPYVVGAKDCTAANRRKPRFFLAYAAMQRCKRLQRKEHHAQSQLRAGLHALQPPSAAKRCIGLCGYI